MRVASTFFRGLTTSRDDKPLPKKFFAKSKTSEVLQETNEHYENSQDDFNSSSIKKEGLGIIKNRKKLLWDRVKHDNAKIKKLKEV